MKCFRCLLVLCFSLLAISLSAQKASFQFFTTQDGLSGNITSTVIQDRNGFLWLYNNSLLHRFDGRTFEPFLPPPELKGSGERLVSGGLLKDSLLMSIGKKHLFTLNLERGTWQSYALPLNENAFHHWESRKYQDEVLISDYAESLGKFRIWKFKDRQFAPSPLLEFDSSNIPAITHDPNGKLYFYKNNDKSGKGNNFKMWDVEEEVLKNFTLDELTAEATIQDIFILDDGSVSMIIFKPVRPKNGPAFNQFQIFSWNPKTGTLTPHPLNRFTADREMHMSNHLILKNGNMWIAGPDRRVFYYDADKDTLTNFTPLLLNIIPNSVDLNTPKMDQNGSVWFGTQLGLLKATLLETKIDKYFYSPINDCLGQCSFRGMSEDAQGNVFANYYHGIVRFKPFGNQENTFYKASAYPIPLPSDIHCFQDKLLLNNGELLDPNLKNISAIEGSKNDLAGEEGLFAKGVDGRIWWVYYNELFYLDDTDESLRWHKVLAFPPSESISNEALHFGKYSGLLYVGREGRLFQYGPETQKEKWFDFAALNLAKTRVLAIEEDVQRNLWLGTDAGLIYLNPKTQELKRYTQEDGLANNFVCGMLTEGDSSLWLSTNHGLSRFSIANESFINFFEEDGLTENEFNRKSYFKSKDGRLYFGGLRGINAFYPKELLDSFYQQNENTKLSLSAFEYINEKEGSTIRQLNFDSKPRIDIYYHHRSFSFEYALTDYRNPAEVMYSYRMMGYEDTWSSSSKFNFTRFSSLPAGDYTFQVKAKDSHGHWHPNQLAVQVIVHPPWWATWWAYLGYALLIAGISYIIFSFLTKRWELQLKLKQEQEEALRLKNLDSFKSRLYTNITHEFRTPLTVILGMIEQIRTEPDKYLEKGTTLIRSNGQSLLRLINQLLDLSKLEDKSFKLKLEKGDFVSYLRYITESFQTFANSQNISLRFHATLEDLLMDFDPEQIKQVMTNLISNAIKFTPSGGEVKVQLKSLEEQSMAKIMVADTGIGIEEEDLPYIFDRFYQVDGSVTRAGEGTGIGLAHTLELVKLMEGEIEVESMPGKGTAFSILLPVRETATFNADLIQQDLVSSSAFVKPHENDLDKYAAISAQITGSELVQRPKLLIIEDNADVVDYLKACLEEHFQLDIAFNGRIGIERAIAQIPDLIISDVMMPEKDGFEVCDSLKNDERTSHIPIVLLTAKADVASKLDGLRRGADAYLSKPFDKEELLIRLEQLMERKMRLANYFRQQFNYGEALLAKDKMQEAIEIEDAFIQKVRTIIEENYEDEDFGLPELCRKIGMSRSQLYRKMRALINIPPSDFIRNYRLEQAKVLLENADLNVSEVAWKVGFKDLSHFSKAFQAMFGEMPSSFRA